MSDMVMEEIYTLVNLSMITINKTLVYLPMQAEILMGINWEQ